MFLHGGHGIVLEPGKGSWSLETEPGAVMDGTTVEHIKDAARVLGRYADALGVRTFPRPGNWDTVRQDLVIKRFAEYCEKPIINLESTRRHPCQGLADAMTLREKFGGDPRGKRFVLMWAWHPKALPTAVPASAAISAAMLGMEVVIARPDDYELDPDDTALIRQLARDNGAMIHINNDPDDALVGADAVYVKSWGSVKHYNHPEEEATMRAGLVMAASYLNGDDPCQPLASPIFADLSGLPPILCLVGGDEVLLDDSLRLVRNAGIAGVDATVFVAAGMQHIFPIWSGVFPEADAAIALIGDWVRARCRP